MYGVGLNSSPRKFNTLPRKTIRNTPVVEKVWFIIIARQDARTEEPRVSQS